MSRTASISAEIYSVLEEISGEDVSDQDPQLSFVEQGFDSLILTQVALSLSKRVGVHVKLRHLVDEYPSCAALTDYLDAEAPADKFADVLAEPSAAAAPPIQEAAPPPVSAPVAAPPPLVAAPARLSGGSTDSLEILIEQQLALMAQQLQLLGAGAPDYAAARPVLPQPQALPAIAPSLDAALPAKSAAAAPKATSSEPEKAAEDDSNPNYRHGPQLVIRKGGGPELLPAQERFVDETLRRYEKKTRASKEFTTRNRPTNADPRTVAGFSARLKEGVYPIVAKRSSGCRIWDLDDNEYVDMLSGYGSNFFGFGAKEVKEAINQQMDVGMEIGPQSNLVEEVSNLFLEFIPHFDRVAYCNTGSEAVLATFRLARTVTGRDLMVMFEGGYHGMFDEVVVRPTKKRTMPAAPGIPRAAVDNILVLPWNDPESLEIIRKRGDEIAGVIVEPVQSRAPEVVPKEFLKSLRQITRDIGAALIFDEVVCGFRIAPGGGQEYFGIQADMASYGKVVGGGISIGIVAGRKEYMDALDGGPWQYGDSSTPEVGVTYFAGTFVRHPIALAAARAALLYMKEHGPELQASLNKRCDEFALELNTYLKERSAPLEVLNFGSIFKINPTEEVPYGGLLYHHLRLAGVHVWDGRPCFLTLCHQQAELEFIVSAFKQAVEQMFRGGLFRAPGVKPVLSVMDASAPPVQGAKIGRDRDGTPAWYVPDADRPGKYLKLESVPGE